MNRVVLIGRTTDAPEVRYNDRGFAIAKFTLAVPRGRKNKDGEDETDFIHVTAFGKSAEFLERYGFKGQLLAVAGELHTDNYEKDGQKLTWTEVAANKVEALTWPEKEREPAGADWNEEDFTF